MIDMSVLARQLVFELAAVTRDLRLHLEHKQEVLLSEQAEEIGKVLSEEGLILQRIKRKQKALDAELHQLGKMSEEGGYNEWLLEIYPDCSIEEQQQLTRMAEDTIACQEMQISQQELLRRSLIYYESMSRFLSGVREWTYKK
ncbi:MAG: hypothetical protein FWE76_05700 [Symbiobacteriaceae bacterium]|nr:hypothetical protein [Symbiobacteriaceae bacterium]